jgi:predicted TIM-barrel fold metal-dependent hydrolase
VMESPVPVLFDHFGGAQPSLGLNQPGFDTLLKLVHSGKAYVDISAPYRISKQAPDYPDVVPIAKAVIAANPERVTWGTGWPHPAQEPGRSFTDITPLYHINDGRNLNLLATWTSGAAQLKLALVENPAKLYGF